MNITGKKVHIRDSMPEDLAQNIMWSLDSEIRDLDPPAGKFINLQQFSIDTLNGELIGTCSFYNQTLDEVQLGIRIGNRNYWDKGYGTEVVGFMVNHWLYTMSVARLWLKVLPMNARAIACYSKCGFSYAGELALDGYEFTVMEIRRGG